MPVDFDSLGTYLRQERERQQVSLQAMAGATKIQLKEQPRRYCRPLPLLPYGESTAHPWQHWVLLKLPHPPRQRRHRAARPPGKGAYLRP